jgi:hypothetical protein
MSDFSSLLGLSEATLQRLGDAYEGYAAASGIALRIHPDPAEDDPVWTEKQLLMGSCYVLAAIYRSILDPGTSIPLFGVAAGIYRRQNNSFWKPLAICGLNREWLFGQEAGRVEGHPQEFFYELLRQYYLFNSGDENALGRMLEHASSSPVLLAQPVGNPPAPLHETIAFIRGDIEKVYYQGEAGEDGDRAWAAGLRVLLKRTGDQLRVAQRDRWHWGNEIGVLPFEPDILATLLGFCIRTRNRAAMRLFAEEEARSDSPALFLVRLALEMIAASR